MKPVFHGISTGIAAILITVLGLAPPAGAAHVKVRAGSFSNVSKPASS